MPKLLLPLLLLLATPALATDYYVRTDGNDANTGLANTSGGAWLSPSKCAALTAGNRCRIQPGEYYVTSGITQANSGSLKGNDVETCTCTKGSTTITCADTVSGVAAGDWVRCDASGSYFNWARVGSVVGSTINLESAYLGDGGYLGESTGGTHFLDVASMVEVVGDGSPGTVILTRGVAQPVGVTWTQSSTYPEVYSYLKTDAPVGSVWRAPTGMRQTTGAWDKWFKSRDGQDPWIQLFSGSQPCTFSTCEQQAHTVAGSYCDDGTRVWVRAFRDANPASIGVRASSSTFDSSIWASDRDYFVFRNIVIDAVGHEISYSTSTTSSIYMGGSNMLIKDVTSIGGNCRFNFSVPRTRMEIRGVDCLDKVNAFAANVAHSGLRFYDFEVRGGQSNGMLFDYLNGASSTDRVMFDRLYLHRVFNYYIQPNYSYDCTNGKFPDDTWEAASAHGADIGNPSTGTPVTNIIIQNSIVEVTGDGFGFFNTGNNVTFRNCTIGVSHSYRSNTRAETIRFGAGTGTANITSYNNLFYLDEVSSQVDIPYNGFLWNYSTNWNSYVGNNNLYLYPWNTVQSLNAPTSTETFKGVSGLPDYSHQTMITSFGQETNSITVCYGGCTAANAIYYNAGASSRNYFVKPYVNDGTASNYTPVLLEPPNINHAINKGLNAQCPEEDFYGNPRSDGQCDIGAVELQGGVEPAGPHRTDILPGTILR